MLNWRTGGAAVGALSMLGIALQPVGAQTPAPPFPPGYPLTVAPPPPAPPSGATSATPTGSPGAWVTTNDYPTNALRAEAQGTTAFRLDIGSNGLVTGCTITDSSGSQELDTATCQLVTRRARFVPARDPQGRAVAGTYSNRVRWVIPQDGGGPGWIDIAAHPIPGASVISFVVGPDGHASDCRLVSGPNPGNFMLIVMPCGMDARFPVYTDAVGRPVARTVRMTISVTLPGSKPAPRRKRRR